jgi:hypothetical protein
MYGQTRVLDAWAREMTAWARERAGGFGFGFDSFLF